MGELKGGGIVPTAEDIKTMLCTETTSTNDPVGKLVEWAEREHHREMLRHLRRIQQELCEEVQAWDAATAFGDVSTAKARASRWSFHCVQAKAYYQAAVDESGSKKRLRRLLLRR